MMESQSVQTKRRAPLRPRIRWMILRDMAKILDIEQVLFGSPWTHADFIRCLRGRNRIGMVAEHDDVVIGYMIYELGETRLDLLNFAVAVPAQRHGVGTAMIERLIAKLSPRRRWISLLVSQANLEGQLFFRARGFRAVEIIEGRFDGEVGAYKMVYRLPHA